MVISDKATIGEKKTKTWIDLINESVHTSDDVDIGDTVQSAETLLL